jgi:hypothetical protein
MEAIMRLRVRQLVDWTDEKVLELRTYIEQGYTGGKIAELMAITRSAVNGKANRLGLTIRGKKDHMYCAPERARPIKPRPPVTAPSPPPSFTEPTPERGATIMELREGRCRWPLWSHADRPTLASLYCGCDTSNNRYCLFHRNISLKGVVDDQSAV